MPLSFFRRSDDDPEVLLPRKLARSLWADGQLHGIAVSGALARAAERAVRELGRDDLRAARWTVDLFRPASTDPCHLRTEVVREANRLCLVDVVLEQGGRPVARASGMFLKATEPAPGAVWEPTGAPAPPPEELAPPSEELRLPMFSSEGVGWTSGFEDHQNAGRKATWQVGVPIVPDEQPSGFVAAASIADVTSMVTHWGDGGIEHINTDITLTLAREPVSTEIGLYAVDRVSADGIAVGTAVVYDRAGRLGTGVVTALANAKRTVDPTVRGGE